MNIKALEKLIGQITSNDSDEPDLYAYLRDLLTKASFDLCLMVNQIVIDSAIDESRRRPDLVIYKTVAGKPQKKPDYAFAVFEVKPGTKVTDDPKGVFKLKRLYIQPGTRWFFLVDQNSVYRIDCSERHKFDQHGWKPNTFWTWAQLQEPEAFISCFGVLSADNLRLENELEAFKQNKTKYAFLKAEGAERATFAETVREAASLLRTAIETIIEQEVKPSLESANAAIEAMRETYGAPRFFFNNERRPIDFENILHERRLYALDEEDVLAYEARREALMAEIAGNLYALRIEHELLPRYAARQGLAKSPSLADIGATNKKKREEARRLRLVGIHRELMTAAAR